MKIRHRSRFVTAYGLLALALTVGWSAGGAKAADGDTITIGAGKVTGVYYPAAGAICQALNGMQTEGGSTCAVVPGAGSKASLEALRAGLTDFAVVQSDWQFWAHKGAKFFADPKPFTALASVLVLHAEPLVIAVRRDGAIKTFADLQGKRAGIGVPATAERGMMEALLRALGWPVSGFAEVHELAARQQTAALCNNSIDSAVYAVGSPSATLATLSATCDVSLLPLTGPAVDKLLKENTFYRKAAVPAGIYAGVDAAVPTFGVGATLVTRTDVPDAAVEAVVTAVFENFEAFRARHPALTWLEAKQMVRDGLSVPLHPAAERYFANREGS
jgi:TRAP transporter TAXI family solute receptor